MNCLRHPWLYVLFVVLMPGCASVAKKETPAAVIAPNEPAKPEGIYHKVSKQESLWRIARTYGVSLDVIIKANNIPNAAIIEQDQLIFIPGAKEVLAVVVEKRNGKPDEFMWPVKGRVVSYFKDAKGLSFNKGIDIAAAQGEVVAASRDGKVIFADYLSGYGYSVIVDHRDGFYTVYGHQSVLMVKPGQEIAKGAPIGQVAKSGRLSFVHFEIRKNEESNNPLYFLP